MNWQYDFFFSYRHKPLDGEITQKTFNLVESYRLPRALREQAARTCAGPSAIRRSCPSAAS